MKTNHISSQLKYLDNLLVSLENNQTNMVPGFLVNALYRLLAFHISNKNIRISLFTNESRQALFLENLMLAILGKSDKIDPKLEYSYLYLAINTMVQETKAKYSNLDPNLFPYIFLNTANLFCDRVLLPATADSFSETEIALLKQNYTNLVYHFYLVFCQKYQNIQKLSQLQQLKTGVNK
jgi:hypothetical protein